MNVNLMFDGNLIALRLVSIQFIINIIMRLMHVYIVAVLNRWLPKWCAYVLQVTRCPDQKCLFGGWHGGRLERL